MQTMQSKPLLIRQFSMDDLKTARSILDLEMQWKRAAVSLRQRRQDLQYNIMLAKCNNGSRLFAYQ